MSSSQSSNKKYVFRIDGPSLRLALFLHYQQIGKGYQDHGYYYNYVQNCFVHLALEPSASLYETSFKADPSMRSTPVLTPVSYNRASTIMHSSRVLTLEPSFITVERILVYKLKAKLAEMKEEPPDEEEVRKGIVRGIFSDKAWRTWSKTNDSIYRDKQKMDNCFEEPQKTEIRLVGGRSFANDEVKLRFEMDDMNLRLGLTEYNVAYMQPFRLDDFLSEDFDISVTVD